MQPYRLVNSFFLVVISPAFSLFHSSQYHIFFLDDSLYTPFFFPPLMINCLLQQTSYYIVLSESSTQQQLALSTPVMLLICVLSHSFPMVYKTSGQRKSLNFLNFFTSSQLLLLKLVSVMSILMFQIMVEVSQFKTSLLHVY